MTEEEGERRTSDRVDLKHDKEVFQHMKEARDRQKEVDTVE